MKRRLTWALLALAVLGLARFAWYAQQRRLERDSYEIARLVKLSRDEVAPRPPHLEPPTPGSVADAFAREPTVAAARAADGQLPPGLPPPQVKAELERVAALPSLPLSTCLDALGLSRDVARGSGLQGMQLAEQVTRALLPACAEAIDSAGVEQKRTAAQALERILAGTPSLKRAVQLSTIDHQLQLFGGLMRAEDVEQLPPSFVRPTPTPIEWSQTVSLGRRWSAQAKTWERIIDALELPPHQRAEFIAHWQQSLEGDAYRDVNAMLATQPQRVAELRWLKLLATQDLGRAEGEDWPALTEVEAAEVQVLSSSDAERTLRGPFGAVTLHAG